MQTCTVVGDRTKRARARSPIVGAVVAFERPETGLVVQQRRPPSHYRPSLLSLSCRRIYIKCGRPMYQPLTAGKTFQSILHVHRGDKQGGFLCFQALRCMLSGRFEHTFNASATITIQFPRRRESAASVSRRRKTKALNAGG